MTTSGWKIFIITHMIHLTRWNFSFFNVFRISKHHSRGIWKLDSVIQLLYKLASLGRVSLGYISIQNLTVGAAEANVPLAIDMVVLIISPVKKDTSFTWNKAYSFLLCRTPIFPLVDTLESPRCTCVVSLSSPSERENTVLACGWTLSHHTPLKDLKHFILMKNPIQIQTFRHHKAYLLPLIQKNTLAWICNNLRISLQGCKRAWSSSPPEYTQAYSVDYTCTCYTQPARDWSIQVSTDFWLVTLYLPRAPWPTRAPGPRTRGGAEAVEALASFVSPVRPRGHGAPGLAQASGGALVIHDTFDDKYVDNQTIINWVHSYRHGWKGRRTAC